MPAKKRLRSTASIFRKPKPLGKVSKFQCPNPDEPLTLKEIVDRMQYDTDFAKFIAGLLCASYTDDKAKACLASYYQPTPDELTGLCIPKQFHRLMMACTVPPQDLLIAVPARMCANPNR
jgi:hypothetical protein